MEMYAGARQVNEDTVIVRRGAPSPAVSDSLEQLPLNRHEVCQLLRARMHLIARVAGGATLFANQEHVGELGYRANNPHRMAGRARTPRQC